MRICSEGQDTLADEKLECIISPWKQQKNIALFCNLKIFYTHLLA